MPTIKNHFFDNTNIKIVGKDYDDETFLNASSYICLNTSCEYTLNLKKHNIVIAAGKMPLFIRCPICNGTMISESVKRFFSLYNKKLETLERYSAKKYNAAKILSLKRLYSLNLTMKNSSKKRSLVDDFIPEFQIILEYAPFFMEIDTIEHFESLITKYATLFPDYKKLKRKITISKKLCNVYKNIYALIEPEKKYKQVDFIKDFFEYKTLNPNLFPYIPQIGLIDDATYKSTIENVIYCWGKAGLVEKEKINNRVYFLKRKECEYEKLDIYPSKRFAEISR